MARNDNPYLLERKKRKILKFFSFFIFLMIILFLGYFLCFGKYFLIREIKVSSAQNLYSEDIKKLFSAEINQSKFWILPDNNFFFLNRGKIINILLKEYPEFLKIETTFNFKDQVFSVKTELRQPIAEVFMGETSFFVDQNGIAFPKSFSAEKILKIIDNRFEKPDFGNNYYSKKLINFVFNLDLLFLEKNFNYWGFVIESEYLKANFIKIVVEKEGWYFLTLFDFNPQAIWENLDLIIFKELKGDLRGLQYIDLRYSDKAFYKKF